MRDRLSVLVEDKLIIVTRPGTSFSATYGLEKDAPNLTVREAEMEPNVDKEAFFKFRAEAFKAATRKARKLGWIE
jgi:hypothetical protein